MTTNDDVDASSIRTGESGNARVLYVDTEDAFSDGIADRLRARLADGLALHTTTGGDALDTAVDDRLACLVLGNGIDRSVQSTLLAELDCPSILFANEDPVAVPDPVLEQVDTIVERGNGDRSIAFLAEKVVTLATERTELDDGLSGALSIAEDQIRTGTALFLVDDDGAVVWSNRPFEAAFPVDQVDTTIPETDGFDARLDAIVSGLSDDGRLVELGGDPAEEGSFVLPTTERARYYVYDSYPVRAVDDDLTLERFEDVTERVDREARSRRLELLVEQAQDGLYTLDRNGVVDFCNESFAANLGYDREELIGEHVAVILAPGELEVGQETLQYLLDHPEQDSTEVDMTVLTASSEHREMSIHYTLLPTEDDTYGGLMGVVRDVTERNRRERRIESQHDELATLDRTNVLIQEIISALNDATSREELQQIVCDRLVESGQYGLAWVGERRGANDVLVPLTSAGEATEYLDDIEVRTDESQSGRGPGGRAYRSGAVQVVPDVRTAEQFGPWRERALDAGLESMAAIPLCHGETTHGILAVYATEPDAFTDRITESFSVLGETIGLALTAIQNKRLLQRDATVLLAFRSRSDDACLVWLASACDCTLETAGAVETDDGVIQYLRVDGAAPERVVESIRESEGDGEAAVTRTGSDPMVEVYRSSALSVELSEVGARLRTATSRPDGVRIVVEASADADVRAIQDVVERFNPDIELVSKTEGTEPFGDEGRSPLSALTDRQREVLRAAYLAGYYDWHRETTAEELAESLGIASPTLHQHLRRAEQNLLEGVLDL